MLLMDGKALAARIVDELARDVAGLTKQLRLAIVVVGEDPVIAAFIAQKQKAARQVGIDVRIYRFEERITTRQLRARLKEIVHEPHNACVVVQLPLPAHIAKQHILNAVTPEKDADVLSARAIGDVAVGKSAVLPPVVGAVKTLLEAYDIPYHGRTVAIIGAGSLVGKPCALWLLNESTSLSVVFEHTEHPQRITKEADIMISGTGQPNIITADWVKAGAAVIDAGTSESNGKLAGDVDVASVEGVAKYLAPVPGGVGPLTVAMLLKNCVTLAQRKKR